ncbi:unnamed protein product [Caenorhabditis brenneri]
MEPAPKRARISGDEMNDGPAPLSLFDLSLKAMIDNAKNGVCSIEVDKISPLITDQIWKQSSLLDIVSNVCHPGTFDFFSKRVIKPSKIIISFFKKNDEYPGIWDVWIEFEDERILDWSFWNLIAQIQDQSPDSDDSMLMFQIGAETIKTKLTKRTENFLSLVSGLFDSWKSRFEIIDWLVEMCRCEEINITFARPCSELDEFLNWNRWKTANSLYMLHWEESEFLQSFLKIMNERNLKTTVAKLKCPQPLPLFVLKTIIVGYMSTNLSSFSFDDLAEYASTACKLCYRGVKFKIPRFNTQQIGTFKSRLNLSDDINLLKKTYTVSKYNKKVFKNTMPTFYSINANNTASVYYFLEKKPGVFNKLLATVWRAKRLRVQ